MVSERIQLFFAATAVWMLVFSSVVSAQEAPPTESTPAKVPERLVKQVELVRNALKAEKPEAIEAALDPAFKEFINSVAAAFDPGFI